VIPVAEGPLFARAAVYPNNGQSLGELAEIAPDVVEAVVVAVRVGEADFPPLQAVAASPTEPISTMRLTSSIVRRDGITGAGHVGQWLPARAFGLAAIEYRAPEPEGALPACVFDAKRRVQRIAP